MFKLFSKRKQPDERAPFEDRLGGENWPQDKCLLTLLCAASLADGEVSTEEELEIEALSMRTHTLNPLYREMPSQLQSNLRGELHRRLSGSEHDEPNGFDNTLRRACAGLAQRADVRESAYAHALDIVYADREMKPEERVFIDTLGTLLEIDPVKGRMIQDVMEIKNSF